MESFVDNKYLTQEEFENMSEDELMDNFPSGFIESPYNYCGRYGKVQFVQLNCIYVEIFSITLKLNNGKIFPFTGYKTHYSPDKRDLN